MYECETTGKFRSVSLTFVGGSTFSRSELSAVLCKDEVHSIELGIMTLGGLDWFTIRGDNRS